MRALVYRGVESLACETVPDPAIEAPGDAVVRVEAAGVCGSDLHVWHGRETPDAGTVMGHELAGEVVEVGPGVQGLARGDRVAAPFTTSCGDCFYCRTGLTARCERGELFGWVEGGRGLHGAQAEYVRVPLAATTLVRVPEGVPAALALLAGDASAPASLRDLAGEVRRRTALPALGTTDLHLPAEALRGVASRKRVQLAALLGALSPLAVNAERIVDVGAGRGHFSRLASELFRRQTVALDRDAALLRQGGERSDRRARLVGPLDLRFEHADVGQQELALRAGDLAVGLHACGELGDRLVSAAAGSGCDVALVSCCLQKTSSARRRPLSLAGCGLDLRRGALGLANLSPREEGVEASLVDNVHAREARLALRYLLRARGPGLGEFLEGDGELRAGHGELLHGRGDRLAERFGGRLALGAQLLCVAVEHPARRRHFAA